MKKFILILAFLGITFLQLYSQPITKGNLVVVRVGDGTATLTSAGTAVFLDEYTTSGTLVQSIAIPNTTAGNRLVMTGTSTSDGSLNLSVDGHYLTFTGYDDSTYTGSSVATLTTTLGSMTNNRIVCRIDQNKNIDLTTRIADGYSGSNCRGAVSVDGTAFWVAGTAAASANAGVRYVPYGNTANTATVQLSSAPTNIRTIGIYNSQLYATSASSPSYYGILTVGTGLPTTTGQTAALLNGFPTSSGPSTYAFVFGDANTLYVADSRATTGGGLQKWFQNAGTWTLVNSLLSPTNTGLQGLSGYVSGSTITLYATTTDNNIVTITDNGVGANSAISGSFSTALATAATNTAFRGIAYANFNPTFLPVELTSFTGNTATSGGVVLNWTTATEKNNSGFDVERSADNTTFTKIGFVKGNGTTTQVHVYRYADLLASGKAYYRLKQTDYDGTFEYSKTVEVVASQPKAFSLSQNYPNPFNPSTKIAFTIASPAQVSLKVYDVLGREVTTLVNEQKGAGNYEVSFDASKLASGLYLYKLTAGSYTQTRKLLLVK
jgi:hypothetical protein